MNNIDKLMEWLGENHSKYNNLFFKNNKGNRSVYANSNIKANKIVVSIPLKCLIHDGLAENTQIGREFIKSDHSECNNIKLTLIVIYILSTIRDNGFYTPYYNILPDNIENFPIFWRDSTIKLLKGSNIFDIIIDRKNNFINDYNILCKCSETFKNNFSFFDFVYIRTIVGSRNFGININGIHRSAMVPLADMLNHKIPPNVNWSFNNSSNCFEMISNCSIKKNQEINDSYGNKCNSKLLTFYGFTLDSNRDNTINIIIHDKETSLKFNDNLKKTLDDNNYKTLFAFLRSVVCKKKSLTFTNFKDPINIETEICCLTYFHKYLNEKLKKYYSMKYLLNIINKTSVKDEKHIACRYILGEIDIINYYINMSKISLNFLEKGKKPSNNIYESYTNTLEAVLF